MITGQMPIKKSKQGRFQIVRGNTIPALVRRAFRVAEEERPGGNRKDAHEAIDDFVHACTIPFFATQMGRGVVDERRPPCLGTAALSDGDFIHCAFDRANLVINIGHGVVEKPPLFMEPGSKSVGHVNYRAALVDQLHFPQIEVVGDLAASVRQLDAATQSVTADLEYFQRVKAEIDSHIGDGVDDGWFPMVPQRIVADVHRLMGDEDIIVLDNGMHKIGFARNYSTFRPNTVLLDNALEPWARVCLQR